jgi:hypothetical protein
MSQQPPPGPDPGGSPGAPTNPASTPGGAWAPPSGFSPEQPPAWPAGQQPAGSPAPPVPTPVGGPPPANGWPTTGWGAAPPPGAPGYGPPAYGAPTAAPHGQAPQGQPPYGQPTYGQPPYGQPPYGQPPYGQPPYGQPQHPWTPPPQAPKPGIVPLRPLGVGELLDGALGLIRSNPRTVLGLAAAISAASALIQTIGVWAGLSALGLTSLEPSASGDLAADLTGVLGTTLAQLVPALIAGFLTVLASGLFIVLVGAAVLGRRLDGGQAWTELKPRLAALVALTVLLFMAAVLVAGLLAGAIAAMIAAIGDAAALPAVLLVITGAATLVYLYVRLALASPALVIEGLGPIAALGRSWQLARGSWWRVAGILLLSAIITNLLATVVSVPITTVAMVATGFSESMLPTVLAAGVATLVSGIVTLPFSAAVTGLLYTDLRMRREALDIALVAAGVDPHGDPLAPYRRGR